MKTNLQLEKTLRELRKLSNKEKVNLWKRVSYELGKSTRKMREVNISKIDKYCNKDEIALVPGKVLGEGKLTKKITVAAWKFSKEAQSKINKDGEAILLKELMAKNPKGKKVRLIG